MGGEGGEGCGQGQQEGVSQLAGRKGAREVSMAGDGELAPEKEGNGLYLETAMRKAKSKNTVYSKHQGLKRASQQTKNTRDSELCLPLQLPLVINSSSTTTQSRFLLVRGATLSGF